MNKITTNFKLYVNKVLEIANAIASKIFRRSPPSLPNKGITVWVWVEEEDEGVWRGLYLKPGDCVDLSYGGEHDEGWSRTSITTELSEDGTVVNQLICSDGSDCDGRLSSFSNWHCPVEDIHKIKNEGQPDTPDWRIGKCSQRDYAAESMGY